VNLVESLFDRAATDRRRGATEIERSLVDGLLDGRPGWTEEGLAEGAARLRAGQPAMANLRRLASELAAGDCDRVESALRRRAAVLGELRARLADAAWPAVEDARRVLTISRSSAVEAALVGAWQRGWRGETVVFDGSPAGRGVDQARVLATVLGAVRSQPDAAMLAWLDAGPCTVLVGADAVSPRRLVNACGTAALLELARARTMRVVVVADTGKDLPDGELDDLLAHGPTAGEGRPGRNWPLFEAAPLDPVTTRIHE
jgi:translation initiation factor 2B subunit (eIF-2B alpha/beta/delta family)